ncbi:MAG: hypothetical protein QW806_09605 [Nitrososphaerota archaeon]
MISLSHQRIVVNYYLKDEEIFKIIDSNLENIEPDIPLDVKRKILLEMRQILKANKMSPSFRQLSVALVYYRTYGENWKKFYEYSIKNKI